MCAMCACVVVSGVDLGAMCGLIATEHEENREKIRLEIGCGLCYKIYFYVYRNALILLHINIIFLADKISNSC